MSWHHVKFYGNGRCLSTPYLTSNLQKPFKIAIFGNLLVNTSENNWPRKLNFGGHLGGMLHYLRVKFGGNRRYLSGSYFTLNMKKYYKIIISWIFWANISKTSVPSHMRFGGPLVDMLQYQHIKFGVNRRCLTNNVPKKRAQNGHFWACRPPILYFLIT